MRPIDLVRTRLEQCGCNPRGPDHKFEARCPCPAHDDQRPSLSVSEADDGRVLLYCHRGCDPNEIPPQLGLTWSDLFPENGTQRKIIAEYDYVDERGALLFQVVRFDPKDFRQRRPDGRGGWIWKLEKTRRVLYRLPAVIAAVKAGETVYVVEGERDVHALERVGQVATTNPGGAGKWRATYSKSLAGARVVVVAHRDEPGRRHAREVEKSLLNEDCAVATLEPAVGNDVSDHLAAGKGLVELMPLSDEPEVTQETGPTRDVSNLISIDLSKLMEANPDVTEEELGEMSFDQLKKLAGKRSVASEVVELVEEAFVQLFHDREGTPYATFNVDGHAETWRVKSQGFKRWVRRLYFIERNKVALSGQAVTDALGMLESKAQFDGPELEVYLRVASVDNAIFIDLGDEARRVITVTREGWHITDQAPVRFRRTRGMLPLPEPQRGGSLDPLRKFLNVKDDHDWRLFIGWLLAAARPGVPCPVLSIGGEQGSAKSTTERVAREMLDPSTVPLRSPPAKIDDLMVSATSSWIVAYDNLSHLQDWLSDGLARLCTGGGQSKRELFTDGEEFLLDAQRPVVINGIGELVERSDLLDRAIMLELPVIAEADYQAEEDFWISFYAEHAQILGGLCDALASALANVAQVKLDNPTRMADFAKWVTAAEDSLGWESGSFMESFAANRGESHELAIEASIIGPHLRTIAEEGFEDTVAALLELLNGAVDEKVSKQKEWPKSAKGLKSQITRLAPNLRKLGYTVKLAKDTHLNRYTIRLEQD